MYGYVDVQGYCLGVVGGDTSKTPLWVPLHLAMSALECHPTKSESGNDMRLLLLSIVLSLSGIRLPHNYNYHVIVMQCLKCII